MARKSPKGEDEKQPSLFGNRLPEARPPTKVKARRSTRVTPGVSSPVAPDMRPGGHHIRQFLAKASGPIAAWLRKVVAEAAHKLAVKGAIFIMIGLIVAAGLSFFAVLRFDHTPLLARYHDFLEKQIYAGRRSSTSGPTVETSSPASSVPPPKPTLEIPPETRPKPQPWTVDVFPERD